MSREYTILLVDDEEDVLHLLQRTFHSLRNCEVIATRDPLEALTIVAQRKIDLIMSDNRMPVMEGISLLKQVKDISPDTIRVLLSGYADFNALVGAINEGEVFRFISKPWETENLLNIVKSSLKQREVMDFLGNIIHRIQQQMRDPNALKIETFHDAQNVCIKMDINEAIVTHHEIERIIDIILWSSSPVSNEELQVCVGGAVEKKDGKTFLTFDLGDASVRITIKLPDNFKKLTRSLFG